MKNNILIIFLGISLSCLAQDSRLFQNTWHLHNLIINSQHNVPPINNEIKSISLILNVDNSLSSSVCESLSSIVDYDDVNQTFMLTSYAVSLGGGCYLTNDRQFEFLYLHFYTNNLNNPFEYSILSNSDGSKTLTVTNSSGDKAVYSSDVLSLNAYSKNSFSVYPNPVKDDLYISKISELNSFNITIFNIKGKHVLSLKSSDLNAESFNVEKLSKGLYFVLFEDKKGRFAMKKFIKK
ncbi:MAG: T9SS type A sorting domain-containing protein [Flavobacteriaceae bacterium]|jgi:hypothetical protein|nr:T9SS type A sorting domain-containing protein [Flavobacteriaceae bacterium]